MVSYNEYHYNKPTRGVATDARSSKGLRRCTPSCGKLSSIKSLRTGGTHTTGTTTLRSKSNGSSITDASGTKCVRIPVICSSGTV